MGFVIGLVLISIVAFVIAVVLVRPLFVLLYRCQKAQSLLKTFEVTAGWVAVGFGPAIIYTSLFQWMFGAALKDATAKWFPDAPTYMEPAVAFGFIYAVVATVCALIVLRQKSTGPHF